jgi:tetratricopeptide (TPR) repeat protein
VSPDHAATVRRRALSGLLLVGLGGGLLAPGCDPPHEADFPTARSRSADRRRVAELEMSQGSGPVPEPDVPRQAAPSPTTAAADIDLPLQKLTRREQALRDYSHGRYEQALGPLILEVQQHPDDLQLLIPLAAALAKTDRTAESIVYLDRALQAQPQSAEALALRGSLRLQRRDFLGALDDLSLVVADPHADAQLLVYAATANLQLGRFTECLALLDRIARTPGLDPADRDAAAPIEADYLRCVACCRLGRLEQAEQALQSAERGAAPEELLSLARRELAAARAAAGPSSPPR